MFSSSLKTEVNNTMVETTERCKKFFIGHLMSDVRAGFVDKGIKEN